MSLATVQFSRSAKRRAPRDARRPRSAERRRHAGLSKLNSMRRRARRGAEAGTAHGGLPGSVDMLGPIALELDAAELEELERRPSPAIGAPLWGSLERR